MKIKLLSKDLINKIAAGEVIERPASVVKECLENSIDAQATKIEIYLKKSGKKEIIISDNGLGISKEDLELSIKKHATSKISTVDDLFKINTLGFRGEALASISSISKLTIQSKTKEQEAGYEFNPEIEKVGMNDGTKIIVQDLFYNTPARLRYLKSDYIELSHIIEIVEKYALCYPDKYFKLVNDDKTLVQSSTSSDDEVNISSVINKPFTQHLIRIQEEEEIEGNIIELKGVISEAGYLPKNSNYIIFYLNNRYIKNKILTDALIDGFKTMLFLEEKPAAILHINMDSSLFDVNIHPRKLDVKFTFEHEIYQFVLLAVKGAIEKYNKKRREEIKQQVQTRIFEQPVQEITSEPKQLYTVKQKTFEKQQIIHEEEKVKYKILDIIDNTYIILKSSESLFIIDQHALHERVLFEKLSKEFESKTNTQTMISPIIINLSNQTLSKLENIKEELNKNGFEFEYFGTNSIKLTKIPGALFDILDKKKFFENLIDDLNLENISKDTHYKLATKACKAAIKAHDMLTSVQLQNLLDYMFETEIMLTCPHGRPFFIELNKKELEKRFKR